MLYLNKNSAESSFIFERKEALEQRLEKNPETAHDVLGKLYKVSLERKTELCGAILSTLSTLLPYLDENDQKLFRKIFKITLRNHSDCNLLTSESMNSLHDLAYAINKQNMSILMASKLRTVDSSPHSLFITSNEQRFFYALTEELLLEGDKEKILNFLRFSPVYSVTFNQLIQERPQLQMHISFFIEEVGEVLAEADIWSFSGSYEVYELSDERLYHILLNALDKNPKQTMQVFECFKLPAIYKNKLANRLVELDPKLLCKNLHLFKLSKDERFDIAYKIVDSGKSSLVLESIQLFDLLPNQRCRIAYKIANQPDNQLSLYIRDFQLSPLNRLALAKKLMRIDPSRIVNIQRFELCNKDKYKLAIHLLKAKVPLWNDVSHFELPEEQQDMVYLRDAQINGRDFLEYFSNYDVTKAIQKKGAYIAVSRYLEDLETNPKHINTYFNLIYSIDRPNEFVYLADQLRSALANPENPNLQECIRNKRYFIPFLCVAHTSTAQQAEMLALFKKHHDKWKDSKFFESVVKLAKLVTTSERPQLVMDALNCTLKQKDPFKAVCAVTLAIPLYPYIARMTELSANKITYLDWLKEGISKKYPLDQELEQRFVSKTRDPEALYFMIGSLLQDPRVFEIIRNNLDTFIRAVATDTFHDLRFDPEQNPHLKILSDLAPDFTKKWKIPVFQTTVSTVASSMTITPYMAPSKHLYKACIEEQKFDINSTPTFRRMLEAIHNGQEKELLVIKKAISSRKSNIFERERLLCEIATDQLTVGHLSQSIARLHKLFSFDPAFSKCLREIEYQVSEYQCSRSIAVQSLIVEDTTHFNDLMICGSNVKGSCQNIFTGDSGQLKSIFGYILNGQNRILQIKEPGANGRVHGRCFLRALVNKGKTKAALQMELTYPATLTPYLSSVMQTFAMQRAKEYGLPLISCNIKTAHESEETWHSFGGIAEYDYVDSGIGVTKDSKYFIENCYVLQS